MHLSNTRDRDGLLAYEPILWSVVLLTSISQCKASARWVRDKCAACASIFNLCHFVWRSTRCSSHLLDIMFVAHESLECLLCPEAALLPLLNSMFPLWCLLLSPLIVLCLPEVSCPTPARSSKCPVFQFCTFAAYWCLPVILRSRLTQALISNYAHF